MVKRIILTIIIVMGAGVAVTEPAPDSAIEDALVSSLLFIDDPASAREEFEYAKQLSGYDTNRLARLIAGLARTNDSWIAGGMIGRLGVYGSSENLPFLYSQVSNVEYGVRAVRSILRIEGVTSNSLAMVDDYLSMTNMAMPSREDICLELLRIRNRTNPGISLSNCVDMCALRFFASDDVYSEWYDGLAQPLLPGYKTSKRRLTVLRAVQSLGLSKYNAAFVTNAINELVAYPEADLPE